MILRLAYPDELARARKRLEGVPIPPHAQFLVHVKELPVERIIASSPYWSGAEQEGKKTLHFYPEVNDEALLDEVLIKINEAAREMNLTTLRCDVPLADEHPLSLSLKKRGFTVGQSDRYFQVPGYEFKKKSFRVYKKLEAKIPANWEVKSIRGQDPEQLFQFVAQHGLISPHSFKNYWDTANREHFEERYSKVLIDGETIIGAFLITQRGAHELHIHVEASAPEYKEQSGLISTTLRNASCSACEDGFPEIYTWRADSEKHLQTANTALRQGGTELPPKYFLIKSL